MKLFCLFSSIAAASAALAVPTVGNVEIAQGADRVVKISYDLAGGPAIVTFDVATNGVTLGDRAFDRSWGDVNALVTNETGRFTIRWLPPEDFPEDAIAGGGISADVRAWSPDSPPDYAVFDMECGNTVNYYASVGRLPGGIGSATYRKEKLVMRKIPAAGVRWRMGAPSWQVGVEVANEETPRWVTLSEDYYIGVFEFTNGQYLRFMRSIETGADWPASSTNHCNQNYDVEIGPVSNITRTNWRGIVKSWPGDGHEVNSAAFIYKFRKHTGFEFDLPTHAQWEYACRAGQSAAIYNGRELNGTEGNDSSVTNIAWHYSHLLDGLYKKAPVGMLEPNAWGLYDMLGNVWEFALDRHASRPATDVTDPTGPASGSSFKQVGGCYNHQVGRSRCAFSRSCVTDSNGVDYGIRLCCPVNKTWKNAVVVAE